MTLPSFLTRIQNAAGPVLGGLSESDLGERLEQSTLLLEIDENVALDPGHRAAFLLAVNLGARLYPRLAFDAPNTLVGQSTELARSINPNCEFGRPRKQALTLSWRGGEPTRERVTVAASGWNLWLDGEKAAAVDAEPLAALAVATLGIGELFRAMFSDLLPHGRVSPNPLALNWLTLGPPADVVPLPKQVDLGRIHLAGCGAIGQAAVLALRAVPVSGTLVAVDHEALDEGNLQRYLLGGQPDVGVLKTDLIDRALHGHELKVEPVPTRWGADARTGPGTSLVLSALDTKQGRIELQAGLPRELFNAWTQPVDIGVSRHESFGDESCLACLAWPRHSRPSQSKLIADSLEEDELRVVIYLASGVPAGQALTPEQIQPTGRLPLPENAATWSDRSILEDLITRFQLPRSQFEPLGSLLVNSLYRDAVCAEMLIRNRGSASATDVSVPLAHQSALAGILLATWLIASKVPKLKSVRPRSAQARYDVLRGGEQIWPRDRDKASGCICSDPDFIAKYGALWGASST